MRYRVIWSEPAKDDLQAIMGYVAGDDPNAAMRLAARLIACAKSLEHFPNRGAPNGSAYRQLSIIRPYLLRYRVVGGSVEILSVHHGARAPESD